MDWDAVKARLEQYVHESCLPVRVADIRSALARVEELEQANRTINRAQMAMVKRAEAAEAKLAKVVDALEAVLRAEDYRADGGTSVTEQNILWSQAVAMVRAALAAAKGE